MHNDVKHYPDHAILVVYELTPDTNGALNDPDVSQIAIHDTREDKHYLVWGETPFDIMEWGTYTASAFHRDDRIKIPQIEQVAGHPFNIGGPDRTDPEFSVIAWVTKGKREDPYSDAFTIHIGLPSPFDPIGQCYLAGVIANPVTAGDYSPWALCYNWDEDDGSHLVDRPHR